MHAFPLSRADETLITTIGTFRYLTAEQLMRLLYAPSSLSYVQKHLKTLIDSGYLLRSRLPKALDSGSTPFVYSLALDGIRVARDLGLAIPQRVRASEEERRSSRQLTHTLATTDVLITFLAEEKSGTLAVTRYLPEWQIRRQIDSRARFIDAFAEVVYEKIAYPLLIEVELWSKDEKRFKEKIRDLVHGLDGSLLDAFAVEAATILWLCCEGPHPETHRKLYQRWTEEELTRLGAEDLAPNFLLTSCPTRDSQAFLFGDVWYEPFTETPLSLWG